MDFACGDVDGNFLDEIIILNFDNSAIFIYDENNKLLGDPWFLIYPCVGTQDNYVTCGDLYGDGKDLIIVKTGPIIQIYNEVGDFLKYFYWSGGGVQIDCGDINGDGEEEIIVGDFASGFFDIYDINGHIGGFDSKGHFNILSTFCCGDFLWDDDVDEVVITEYDFNFFEEPHHRNYVYFFDQFGNYDQQYDYIPGQIKNWPCSGSYVYDNGGIVIDNFMVYPLNVESYPPLILVVHYPVQTGSMDDFELNNNNYELEVGDFYNGWYENYPPYQPTIEGPTSVLPNQLYTYSIVASDIDNDDVRYIIDWGADQLTTDYYKSGQTALIEIMWPEENWYDIIVEAEDINGAISEPITLMVTVPKNKLFDIFCFYFIEQHPILFTMLRQLLEL
jgi:hypothetical protein